VPGRLHVIEVVGMLGGALLAVSLFLPWYGTDPRNSAATIDGVRGTQSCWDVHPLLRWLVLVVALAPFALAYLAAADRQLPWRRDDLTVIPAMAALALVFYAGALDRPGHPSSAISLRYGWFLAVAGSMVMFSAAARGSSARRRARI
jgi:hypothetical protein